MKIFLQQHAQKGRLRSLKSLVLLGFLFSILWSMVPTPGAHAASKYNNASYTQVDANTITLNGFAAAETGDVSFTKKGTDGGLDFYIGTPGTWSFPSGAAGQVNCTMDFLKVDATTGDALYYQFELTVPGGKGMGVVPKGLSLGDNPTECAKSLSVSASYNGLKGTVKDTTGDPLSQKTCKDSSGFLGWVFCPLLDIANSAINGIYGFVLARMDFSLFAPAASGDAGISGLDQASYDKVHGSWVFVSRLADVLLAVLFIGMVIGQSLSQSNLFSAYTVKRMLPRIVIAFVLINISWYLVTFAIEIGNIVGGGAHDIILAPFSGSQAAKFVAPNNITSNIVGAGILGSLLPAVWLLFKIPQIGTYILYLLFPIFVTVATALVVGMAFIILRQGILILCAVFAPVAIVLWILPGTEKYFHQWRELLTSMILFYPVFQAVVAIGALLALTMGIVK
ncbi:MAG TPA: hypothetical protein VLF60_00925 [Candidatus Saccharimonadales bacterium]|nr:hypothetical protein [Candidatus Saccharimonadales bacterium]